MVGNQKNKLERVKGIEPSSQAWEARVLPLNHTRMVVLLHIIQHSCFGKSFLISVFVNDERRPCFCSLPWCDIRLMF